MRLKLAPIGLAFWLAGVGWAHDVRTLPAGTEVVVRTNEAIQADSAVAGRTYSAVIERDVVDSAGTVAVPKGSNAELIVREVSKGSQVTSNDLVLDLQSVTARGQKYFVSTADVARRDKRGIGANRRTAEMVGGGAALGTLIGAIAGGGKGAVIGAIAGAAAGGTAQVLTKGKEVRVPAETVLTFRLDQPVQLEASRDRAPAAQSAGAARPTASLDGASEGTLPAGSEIVIRTNERIESETATEGRTYSATVEREVDDSSGRTVIRRGSEARLVVRKVATGGRVGSPEVALDLESVTVNGRRLQVSTADVGRSSREGIGRNRRTAEMVGGGAALGTLIGAVAGGGRGAVIGAIAGAAAGGATQVLTRGKEVKVPAETVLTFRLDQPVQLRASR